jgi:hypothetical protein
MSWRPLAILLLTLRAAPATAPVSLHLDNPRYFLFRGRPLVLVTATEHYGSVLNRAFDFDKYLKDAARRGLTLTRTFLLYRELQTPRNPSSPCKPESPDYLAPWPRTGPGKAADGEPVYDLDRWNDEFFSRLRRFLRTASRRGIVVEMTLFSHTYNDKVWSLNPLNARNNKQGVGKVAWPEYDSLRDKALVERQLAYARKVVQETCAFDNVYYEVCNEPAGGVSGHVTPAEVDAWQKEVARVVRQELRRRGCKHLVFGTEPFDVGKKVQQLADSFSGPTWDAINVHPHPFLMWQGRPYDLGNFMARELRLKGLRDFCLAVAGQRKPCILDEDNAASLYRDEAGWTIHRKRAWTAILSGAHYDYIDFSITVGNEAGTPASRRGIRAWMGHLARFIHSFDVIHAKPLPGWVAGLPEAVVATGLAVEGKDYVAYLADAREVTDRKAGQQIKGKLLLSLPAGTYHVRLSSPLTGRASPRLRVEGGKPVRLELAPFRHDLVVRATRVSK